ncbi:ATP-binding cassette domain-containing protein [Brucella pseudogrignonensis]|uniref:ABC transporter family protein n=1 Tax=Brucella pseudogrignonensis TaxID=419475 RepID=A0A256G058_9HYPH|nr:ATP-binding cassette domain-containing protein [Brucella pseudogrignonensis]EMG52829.1 ABC transporter [Ochrobactrum sp. CDB2]MBK0023215.1 sugar ABC transporter ATP-binding protein [Ochrobactrum sp. S45]MBK0045415.1 sugar ABC transporter ATP-binding protein [Ochrobactrum sp. S46]NNV19257.1 sugar ABC transporter ATP-binding protein [Brucella pseudogrignonensis]OYR20462.1 ABC transporter family protein [Brucella pseudogrignonensis]
MLNDQIILTYENLVLAPGRKALSGTIRAGEITGLAGLEGHGQEQFLLALAGFNQPRHSKVEIVTRSGEQSAYSNHHNAARCGVVYLPRDRRATGIFPVLSVLDNFGMPSMPRFSWGGILNRRKQKEELQRYTEFLSIRYQAMDAPITALSGGNQQKVLLARLLALKPRVMLLNDPTRGVDLNTRMKFYEAFRKLAREEGIALVILSSEIEEILQICDSVSVFRDFECSKTISKSEMSMSGVLAAMFGQDEVEL